MPIKEATFWFGITVFGTGLFGWMEGGERMPYAIAIMVIGFLVTAYSVLAHHKPQVPKLPIWIGLLILTWGAIGYDYYDRHYAFGYDPNRVWNNSKPLERVYNPTFANETVVLDGKFFINPTFDNVTLVYNGLGPFGWDKANWIKHDGKLLVRFASRNAIVTQIHTLDVTLAQATGCNTLLVNLGPQGQMEGVTPSPTK
jgi:hypothetical protein